MSIELSYDILIKGFEVGGELEQFVEVNIDFFGMSADKFI